MKLKRMSQMVVLSCMLAGAGLAQQKAGLLLTTTVSADGEQQFHGYWITRDGGKVEVRDGRRLLVPRKTGWWEFGITSLSRVGNDTRSEELWAAPLGHPRPRKHVIPVSDDDTCPDDLSTYSVSWVGNDYAAVQHDYESTCSGRTDSGGESALVKLDQLRVENAIPTKWKLSELAGAEALRAMNFGAEVANTTNAKNATEDEPYSPIEVDETTWIVAREKAHYRLVGTTARNRERGGDSYDIPYDPPQALVGPDSFAIGWDAVLDKHPDAVDAYTSPGGDTLVVVTPHFICVYAIADQKIGALLKRIAIDSPSVIAAQWATGENVDRWSETIVPAFAGASAKTEKTTP